MNGKFIRKCIMGNILEEYSFNGKEVMKYKNIALHLGDIVSIVDDWGQPLLPTFVRPYKEDGFSIYSFEKYFHNGWVDNDKIKDITIVKGFNEIETGYNVKGLIAKIYQYDVSTILQHNKSDNISIDKNLPIDYRIDLLQMMINSHLTSNPTEDEKKQLTEWNKELLILKAIESRGKIL